MCISAALLVVYIAALLAAVWVQDQFALGTVGTNSTASLAPETLTVFQLKSLLDARGISYSGVLEKGELANRVLETGRPSIPDLLAAAATAGAELPPSRVFTQGSEFYEVVEDAKDSAWLVQVQPQQGRSVMEQQDWDTLRRQLAGFGIRFGTFSCQHDVRFCRLKEWSTPRLVLALPQGYTVKADVFMRAYSGQAQARAVQQWVAASLAARIKRLRTAETAEEWFDFVHNSYSAGKYPVRLLYVSPPSSSSVQQQPVPMFVSALTVRFTGRVKFGRLTDDASAVSSALLGSLRDETAVSDDAPPAAATYVLSTPERNYTYGSSASVDLLNMRALGALLTFLSPDANDLLVAACCLTNAMCTLSVSLACGRRWRRRRRGSSGGSELGRALWLCAKGNGLLLALWLPSGGGATLAGLPVLSQLLNAASWLLRQLVLSRVGAVCRLATALAVTGGDGGWTPAAVVVVSFATYCTLVSLAAALLTTPVAAPSGPGSGTSGGDYEGGAATGAGDGGDPPAWFDVLFHRQGVAAPPTAIAGQLAAAGGDVEEGLRAALLIERLSAPTFWLQPYPEYDYVSELPSWRHGCDGCSSAAAANDRASTSKQQSSQEASSTSCSSEDDADECARGGCGRSSGPVCCDCNDVRRPAHVLRSDDCPICLECYRRRDCLAGLPCGHSFHRRCIARWLLSGNSLCPVCRWPACLRKSAATASLKIHME